MLVCSTSRCMEGTYIFLTARVTFFNSQTSSYIMLLEVILCHVVPLSMMHVNNGKVVCRWRAVFFFLSFSLISKKYWLTLFVFGISILVLILFISNFYSWLFYKCYIFFQFSLYNHNLSFFFNSIRIL